MLFNSFEFIFLFLPITLGGFFLTYRFSSGASLTKKILIGASLFFYSWWLPRNLPVLIGSILFNYALSRYLKPNLDLPRRKKIILWLGIASNLSLLAYFKYLGFIILNINSLIQVEFNLNQIALPLAISFFTFQQIAYLVEVYNGSIKDDSFLDYVLFVSFFPQLIAGPIVRYQDVVSQFRNRKIYRVNSVSLSVGSLLFSVGLFKKVVLADRIAVYVSPVFNAAAQGLDLSFFEAWIGALAYTLQLYFDFSGYSDMALGIACLFGVHLPINFNSPYKATSIIDFWRRWHITLSNFLRDYLYIPLGGNRQGRLRQYSNLMATMLLGGLWHGAGWTFVIWGGLHGAYLVCNHLWRTVTLPRFSSQAKSSRISQVLGWALTFLAVIVSWVFFRATSLKAAIGMLGSMFGTQGISLPQELLERFEGLNALEPYGIRFEGWLNTLEFSPEEAMTGLLVLLAIVLLLPNIYQWLGRYSPSSVPIYPRARALCWRPNLICAVGAAAITVTGLLHINRVSEFLYFQF